MDKLTRQTLIWLGATFLFLGLIGCERLVTPGGDTVERVSDGDTLVVKGTNGKNVTVRFACVDAPEIPHSNKEKSSKLVRDRNQFSWGAKAQERVQQLVKQGGDRVTLKITDSDRYGRKVAEVRLKDGTFIQQVLLREGLAKAYRPYLNKCPSKDIVQQTEAQAQEQKLGIWSDRKFVDPWEYRQFSKSAK
ncbi:thermonuclease family protein [Cylindrospermum sp. FACHB-282]|uniref:thermonuclease family protein n=1 Tax=Cylindrospermum sp. FACHB-282 TaxID=2692794 RepID=UPI001687DA77|nr:thermonuclease family protein [Cylindrospermum sp. FACHB-282]MBD2386673.1 thermonuclease family protein [Cylindrospermum sp. FACHB-282]